MAEAIKINATGVPYHWPEATTTAMAKAELAGDPGDAPSPHYFGRACNFLAWPFREKPIITAHLAAFSADTQALEVAAYSVRDCSDWTVAEGDQLRRIASWIRSPWHPSWSDATARAVIEFTARSRGEGATSNWPGVLETLGVIFTDYLITYAQNSRIELYLWGPISGFDTLTPQDVRTLVHSSQLFPTGVSLQVFTNVSTNALFWSDDDAMPTAGVTVGWSDDDSPGTYPVTFDDE